MGFLRDELQADLQTLRNSIPWSDPPQPTRLVQPQLESSSTVRAAEREDVIAQPPMQTRIVVPLRRRPDSRLPISATSLQRYPMRTKSLDLYPEDGAHQTLAGISEEAGRSEAPELFPDSSSSRMPSNSLVSSSQCINVRVAPAATEGRDCTSICGHPLHHQQCPHLRHSLQGDATATMMHSVLNSSRTLSASSSVRAATTVRQLSARSLSLQDDLGNSKCNNTPSTADGQITPRAENRQMPDTPPWLPSIDDTGEITAPATPIRPVTLADDGDYVMKADHPASARDVVEDVDGAAIHGIGHSVRLTRLIDVLRADVDLAEAQSVQALVGGSL